MGDVKARVLHRFGGICCDWKLESEVSISEKEIRVESSHETTSSPKLFTFLTLMVLMFSAHKVVVGYHCGHREKPTSQGLRREEEINLKPISTNSTEKAIRALYFESHHSTHLSSYSQKSL